MAIMIDVMEQRAIAGGGLTVSRLCLGTMTFGAQTDAATAERMVDLCLDRGINFFDTANVYTGGESERLLGRALGARRSGVVLASKAGMQVGDHPAGLTEKLIVRALEDSLRRLNTDYLDLFYLHLPDWNTPLEETLAALDRVVREGKVRHAGSSNYPSWQACRMLDLAKARGFAPVRVAQQMYNVIARRLEDEFLPFAAAQGVSTIVYNPLAGGLLTGKHGGAPQSGTRFDGNQTYLDRYWNELTLTSVAELGAAAQRAGRSLVSLALNWPLHHTHVDGIILGASRLEQLEENLAVLADGPLDAAALGACDNVWRRLYGPSPKYNR